MHLRAYEPIRAAGHPGRCGLANPLSEYRMDDLNASQLLASRIRSAHTRRSGRMADRLNVTFCDRCGSWLTRAGLLFWSPARLPVTAPVPGRADLAVRDYARRDAGGRPWGSAERGAMAGLLVPGSARSRYCTRIRPGQGGGSRAWPLRLCWAPPGWLQERRYQVCPAIGRVTQATAGHAEPSPGCYVLRGWRVSPQGMDLGGGPWAEGRQGHVGCVEARQGPPALAHRHRLGLCGERTRPARAAGITGGCHGPRVDRAGPGPPDRRRKPPTSHTQLAGQPRPHQRLPRPGIGFPGPAGGYPAGRVPASPGPAGGAVGGTRTGVRCQVVTRLPGWRLRSPCSRQARRPPPPGAWRSVGPAASAYPGPARNDVAGWNVVDL
jgi:hypothetical protein